MADSQMILAADVGNSRVKLGVFEVVDEQLPQPLAFTAIPLPGRNLADAVSRWLDEIYVDVIDRSVLAGSNPPRRDELNDAWPAASPPEIIDAWEQIPIQVDVETPQGVGIDRLLACFAARQLVCRDSPLIVVDSGTATTVNLITSDGTFRGGAILPGLRLSAQCLHDYTARLPLVDADRLLDDEDIHAPLPGRNTIDAMRGGLFWGQLGAVREIGQALSFSAMMTYAESKPPLMILTGGGGRQLVCELPDAVFIDCLTLHGLALLSMSHAAEE